MTASKKRLLILGGTGDAIALADQAAKIANLEVISSLAGRTQNPIAPLGNVRVGGFGGESGLTTYLKEHQIDLVIDATHPFAAQISFHAARAAENCGLPHLMLVRPAWQRQTSDRWLEVESHVAAAQVLAEPCEFDEPLPPILPFLKGDEGARKYKGFRRLASQERGWGEVKFTSESVHNAQKRVFLTIGRQELAAFAELQAIWFLMRMIDRPALDAIAPKGEILLERGPFTLENERNLLINHQIDLIVSKNSGGEATYAKILAARELGIPVVMIQRPPTPPVEQVGSVGGAIRWLESQY
jgi:precorrin-6A/cobalt-precorrin-6A reductase